MNKNKKIKVVITGVYFHKKGGVVMHTQQLVNHLSKRPDMDLHLVTFGNKNQVTKNNGFTIHTIKKIINIPDIFLIPQLLSIKRKIIEIDPDIVHAQGTFTPYSTAAALLSRKYPTILTVHGISSIEVKFKKGLDYLFHRLFTVLNEKYVISKIKNIITVSPHAKEILEKRSDSNIYVISNGIVLIDLEKSSLNNKIQPSSILFFGVLRREKGIDLLLQAMTKIIEKIPKVHLYIAGAGSQEGILKKLTNDLNIKDYVTFLGFIPEEEKPSIYYSADLYVLPSRYENEPITILEAMSFGKAIVASKIYGIPYLIDDGITGLLFECGDINDLAEKIIVLMTDKNLNKKMGYAGLQKAKEFTWDKICTQTIAIYQKLYKSRGV